jgi:hypothetical protein
MGAHDFFGPIELVWKGKIVDNLKPKSWNPIFIKIWM